ncbi:MAG TPA: nuclear transport factor 2 family protein [Aggregatilineaceae bacterium]|nr:nuclear transport factor 2 family protein [Aggregatilineaceae bacterium]
MTSTTVDVDSIVATATDYAMAFYVGDRGERAERIKRVLHPLLAKRSPSHIISEGKFYEWTTPYMIQIAGDSVTNPEGRHKCEVKVLDISGNIASVRLDADWGVDYMHLAKLDGQWKIVNVLWDEVKP